MKITPVRSHPLCYKQAKEIDGEVEYMEQSVVTTRRKAGKWSMRRTWAGIWGMKTFYLMLLPCLIWYFIFKYLPMYGVVISFKDYNFTDGILNSPWADP